MAKKKIIKRKDKVTKEEVTPSKPILIKKIVKEEVPKKKEEMEEPTLFETPKIETRTKRISPFLEETLHTQDKTPDATLEESLAGVETKNKDETKEFYSQISYGTKSETGKNTYQNPVHQATTQTMQRNVGPLTTADIKMRSNTLTGINSETMAEMRKYSTQNPEQKYSSENIRNLDTTDLNRDRNRNPFLEDAEKAEIRYE